MNRKEFFTAFGRIAILSAMATVVGIFVFRDKISVESDCTINKYCKGCGQLSSCSLPRAIKAKGHGKG